MTYNNPKFRIIYHFMILSNFEREPNHQPTAVKEKTAAIIQIQVFLNRYPRIGIGKTTPMA